MSRFLRLLRFAQQRFIGSGSVLELRWYDLAIRE